jgi:outer membrane protein assembly factor BamB
MKTAFPLLAATCLLAGLVPCPARAAQLNVTQYHNHLSRDGIFLDPAFTQTAAAGLVRDLSFNGSISGNVYAQPLYIEGGPGGAAMVIAVTQSNNVYALNAASGAVVWQVNLGAPIPLSLQPCGNINPEGIVGTPVVDLPSRSLLLDTDVTPDGLTTHHLIYSLNVDTGSTNAGWPVDVNTSATFGSAVFSSNTQNERGALALLNGTVYVPYGGHYGDCGTYHGWIIGIPLTSPASVTAWATAAPGGGAWSVGGIASDGTNLFLATGNTMGAASWGGGEAIIRFQPGPIFSGAQPDYFAPTNWVSLDNSDTDLGGSGPLLVDVPGATPAQLVVALGKDGNAYLLNRTNLGGVTVPLAQAHLSTSTIIQAGATYQTHSGTYVAFSHSGQLTAFRITPTAPPTIATGWSVSLNGRGSPFVTSTDGTNNVTVWCVGSEGDQRLHGFDGDTGAVVYSGGGSNELMTGTRHMQTAIVAHGRIYVANDNRVYAFTVPVPPVKLSNWSLTPSDMFQFSFTNLPGLSFTVLSTTNLAVPSTNWSVLGAPTELPPGQFQFTDPQPATANYQFYRVRSP